MNQLVVSLLESSEMQHWPVGPMGQVMAVTKWRKKAPMRDPHFNFDSKGNILGSEWCTYCRSGGADLDEQVDAEMGQLQRGNNFGGSISLQTRRPLEGVSLSPCGLIFHSETIAKRLTRWGANKFGASVRVWPVLAPLSSSAKWAQDASQSIYLPLSSIGRAHAAPHPHAQPLETPPDAQPARDTLTERRPNTSTCEGSATPSLRGGPQACQP